MHAGSYGCTAATIRRAGETSKEAMSRAINSELRLGVEPNLFYEGLEDVDGTKRMVSLYVIDTEVPTNFSTKDIVDIVVFNEKELTKKLKSEPEKFTPLLRLFWQKYIGNKPAIA